MRSIKIIIALLLFSSLQLLAQNDHVGTWKLLSAKYTSSSGETDYFTNAKVKETKIITPTHFMWMIQLTDSLDNSNKVLPTASSAGGGTYMMMGNDKYIEALEYASWEDYAKDKTNFTLNIDGDIMVQTGTISYPNGSKLTLEETWRRENFPPNNGKHVGTWHMMTQKVTNPKGKTTKTDMSKLKQVKIITPTHWMFISENIDNGKKKFRSALGGSYTLNGTRYVEAIENAEDVQTDYSLRIKGNKLHMVGSLTTAEGEKYIYDETYQREETIPKRLVKQ
ncbi:hypothetical protein Q0590_18995 [Rhodocytophaga aerolata]|uniref:Lipocalin-like domain-containing protein n=1 Tax=Rhodocytophaga aerolata TaxID=455078 RepID=A0ABT8R8E5_9BACT|nr:hypothetical protein [Rhodocytophaga aerolata]MDO1448371.1 hypothetical protein [Rhodocytophaga aerolata]